MAGAPFHNSRVKIARTNQLISQLAQIIEQYDGAYIEGGYADDSRAQVAWTIRVKHTPSEEIEAVLGDVVHNLRAALDLAAVTLARLNNKNPKNVYFPFADSVEGLEEMIRRKNFHRASPEAVDLLRRLKPYRGGNPALRGIHDLDVLDKHHDLIPVFRAGAQTKDLRFGPTLQGMIRGTTVGLDDGYKLALLRAVGNEVFEPIPLRLKAMFGAGQPFAGYELVPALQSLSELVSGVVGAFEALHAR